MQVNFLTPPACDNIFFFETEFSAVAVMYTIHRFWLIVEKGTTSSHFINHATNL